LRDFARNHAIPVAETQAGRVRAWNDPMNMGSIGVTGSSAANDLAREADVVLAIGTRLQDFTTGSRALLGEGATLLQLNIAAFDAGKHSALPLVGDARRVLGELHAALGQHQAPGQWREKATGSIKGWNASADRATAADNATLPSDAQVLGAVNRKAPQDAIMVCAAGGLPGELHKLWRASTPGSYHLESVSPAWVTKSRAGLASRWRDQNPGLRSGRRWLLPHAEPSRDCGMLA
jgi:3D-(3,5/4)-trihydroxycyclohexane-1,2-dione acylhydrolase (decyclizing)